MSAKYYVEKFFEGVGWREINDHESKEDALADIEESIYLSAEAVARGDEEKVESRKQYRIRKA